MRADGRQKWRWSEKEGREGEREREREHEGRFGSAVTAGVDSDSAFSAD